MKVLINESALLAAAILLFSTICLMIWDHRQCKKMLQEFEENHEREMLKY